MTADCTRLDAYRDDRLAEPDARAFESHAASCAACDAALLEDDLGLTALADETCPPDVLAAALAAAGASRRAPDRAALAPARSRRSFRALRLVPVALAAALAVAATVFLLPDAAPDPQVAVVTPPAAPAPPSGPLVPTPEPLDVTPEPAPLAQAPVAPAPRPVRTAPAPAPTASPLPEDLPDDLAVADPIDPSEPTPADVDTARRELALAFALVAEAQTQARSAIADEAGDLTSTFDSALPF